MCADPFRRRWGDGTRSEWPTSFSSCRSGSPSVAQTRIDTRKKADFTRRIRWCSNVQPSPPATGEIPDQVMLDGTCFNGWRPSSAASDPGGGSRRWQRASDGPRQTNPAENSNPTVSLPHPTGSPPASVRHPVLTVNREPRGPFEALSRVTDLDVAAMWTDAFTSPEATWESFRKLRRRTTTAQGRWRTVLTGRTAYPALPIPTFRTVSRSIGREAWVMGQNVCTG